jgi:hypothetical protein
VLINITNKNPKKKLILFVSETAEAVGILRASVSVEVIM